MGLHLQINLKVILLFEQGINVVCNCLSCYYNWIHKLAFGPMTYGW